MVWTSTIQPVSGASSSLLRNQLLGLAQGKDLLFVERLLHHELHTLEPVHSGPGGNEVPDDDVLLEPVQVVPGPTNGRIRQHPRRLLEGRRRDEGLGRQAGLRDSEEERLGASRLHRSLDRPLVHISELHPIDVLALEKGRLSRIRNANI